MYCREIDKKGEMLFFSVQQPTDKNRLQQKGIHHIFCVLCIETIFSSSDLELCRQEFFF